MKRFFSLTVFISGFIFLARVGLSQNSVGIGTSDPNENAVLELVSTNNDQGFLIPKVTTAQRTSLDFKLRSSEPQDSRRPHCPGHNQRNVSVE